MGADSNRAILQEVAEITVPGEEPAFTADRHGCKGRSEHRVANGEGPSLVAENTEPCGTLRALSLSKRVQAEDTEQYTSLFELILNSVNSVTTTPESMSFGNERLSGISIDEEGS
jgi:hypothetical protein